MASDQQDSPQYGLRPVPDPTVLTTEQLFRAISTVEQTTDIKVAALKELVFERFSSVQTQFKSSDKAIEAALDAADKAVSKSETSTLKLIEQQSVQVDSLAKTLYDQITDIKSRLIRIEEGRSTSQTSYSNIVAMLGLVGGILIGAAGLVIGLTQGGNGPVPAPVIVEHRYPAQNSSISPPP